MAKFYFDEELPVVFDEANHNLNLEPLKQRYKTKHLSILKRSVYIIFKLSNSNSNKNFISQ